jgi:DEAD/DEAH box helicase domain-containing protein
MTSSLLLGGEEPEEDASSPEEPDSPLPSPADPAGGSVPWLARRRLGFLDLETCCSAAEVGGWSRCHAMGVSVVVLLETNPERVTVFREADLAKLCRRLAELDLVVGFNVKRFDYRVLQPYTDLVLETLPTLDILEDIHNFLGFRLSLGHLAEATLRRQKTGNGLLALELYKNGRWEELESYCRQDVLLTKSLFEFGAQQGYLIYQHRRGGLVRVPVTWEEERFFPKI